MEILVWIFFGLAAGSVAIWVMPGPKAGGIWIAILVGITGGLIGGSLGSLTAGDPSTAFNIRNLLMAVIGTLMLLFGYRCFAMRAAV